jgi:hypothetical protein
MKLKVTEDKEDDFSLSGDYAYRDGKLYEILESSLTYVAGGCMGKMRAVITKSGEIEWIYPLMSGGFEILTPESIAKYKKIIKLVEEMAAK